MLQPPMEDAEKLTALKKAYADIILNTAKEAAARIMISEKRALRFQQELSATKEESVRLLLRLKQIMDSKVKEADMVSLNQQRKIEELEAQLHEAEDIVRDLREEMQGMQEKLEKTKNKQMQHPNKGGLLNSHGEHVTSPHLNGDESFGSLPRPANQQIRRGVTTVMNPRSSQLYDSGTSDFPSIIARRKHPKLYRNGCTQRIHASEQSLLDGRLAFHGENGKRKDKKLEEYKNTDSDSVEVTESEVELLHACMTENATSKSMYSENRLTMDNEGHNFGIPSELNNNDLPSTNSNVQGSDSTYLAPTQRKHGKFLKYTFERKRKRDSLSSSLGHVSLNKCSSKRKLGENSKHSSDLPKSSTMVESTRDSRRVAQVARQLISLSEKRWR